MYCYFCITSYQRSQGHLEQPYPSAESRLAGVGDRPVADINQAVTIVNGTATCLMHLNTSAIRVPYSSGNH